MGRSKLAPHGSLGGRRNGILVCRAREAQQRIPSCPLEVPAKGRGCSLGIFAQQRIDHDQMLLAPFCYVSRICRDTVLQKAPELDLVPDSGDDERIARKTREAVVKFRIEFDQR